MPGFKIATASVEVVPDDSRFEDDLRAAIDAASQGVRAEVGLRLNEDAPITLNEDVHAAMDLATEGVKAQVGLGLKGDAVEALDADVKAGVELVEQDAKVKVSVDPKSAADTKEGLSSLIVGGIAAGAALAPGLILSAASVATVGLGALVVKSNADIQAEYQHLASDVGDTLSKATAPLVPAVESSMVQVDRAVEQLKPTLDELFVDVEPDLYTFTSGLTGAAEQFLPRFDEALNQSRGILQQVSAGLPAIAAGAGNFFTGLTEDSQATGRGFQSFEQLTGTALGTAGQVIGSFSAAASSALDAVVPAADGALTVIQKLANPATIGAAAGALAFQQWGDGIQSALQKASNAALNLGAKADGAGGLLAKMAPAAENASSGLSKMASVAGGPWGIAIGAGIGLLSGLAASFHETAASASDFTAAVAQDSGQVGSNTEAIISQTLAKNDLSALNKQLGVSTATLIEYAAGDKQAQQQVTAAYEALSEAQVKNAQASRNAGSARAEGMHATDGEALALSQAKIKLDQVTAAVADAIKQQNDNTAALQAAEKATNVFTQEVNAEKLALAQNAQTALVNATALNESLAPQGQLTTEAIKASLAYQQAGNATSQYTSALTALYGQYGDTSQAEAAFTTSLAGLQGQITAGTNAVNLHTKAGAANFSAFQQAATSAETYSEKLYQQTGDAGQAQKALQNAVVQIDAMATKSHLSAGQVQTLNQELFGVKNASDIKLNVDDSSVNNAINRMVTLNNLISGAATTDKISSPKLRASGGPTAAGEAYIVGDGGVPEYFVPDVPGYVYPSVAAGQQAIAAHNTKVSATAAPSPSGGGAAATGAPTFNFFGSQYPTTEQMAQLNMQYATALGGL